MEPASTDPNAPQLSNAELGARLQAAAYAEPPIQPHGLSLIICVICGIMAGVSTVVIVLRIYTRAWLGRHQRVWSYEDSCIVLGYLCYFSSALFAILATHYGLGAHDPEMNNNLRMRTAEYTLYAQVMYGFSAPFIKASVMFTLLKLTMDKRIRWTLYIVLFVAFVMAIIGILASLLYCRPTRAYWNHFLGECVSPMLVVNTGYAWTTVGIVSDWVYAIIPWLVVRNLQMPRRTKMIVMAIMGLGIIASAATIVRAPYLSHYMAATDQQYWNGHITLWCQMESGLGLIAACLPALRVLFKTYLGSSKHGSNSGAQKYDRSGNPYHSNRDVPLVSITARKSQSGPGKWERLEDEKGILQERTVTVESHSMNDFHRSSSSEAAL